MGDPKPSGIHLGQIDLRLLQEVPVYFIKTVLLYYNPDSEGIRHGRRLAKGLACGASHPEDLRLTIVDRFFGEHALKRGRNRSRKSGKRLGRGSALLKINPDRHLRMHPKGLVLNPRLIGVDAQRRHSILAHKAHDTNGDHGCRIETRRRRNRSGGRRRTKGAVEGCFVVRGKETYGTRFGYDVVDGGRDFTFGGHHHSAHDEGDARSSFLRRGGQPFRVQDRDGFAVTDFFFNAKLRCTHPKGHPGRIGCKDFDVGRVRRRNRSQKGAMQKNNCCAQSHRVVLHKGKSSRWITDSKDGKVRGYKVLWKKWFGEIHPNHSEPFFSPHRRLSS